MLEALREASVTVDEELLLGVLSDLENTALTYAQERVVGQTLLMLATMESERAAKEIERGLVHPSQRVREDAARAKALAAGLDDPLAATWKELDIVGWDGLSETQQRVLAVRSLIDEVNNGGFLQYFVNSSGDNWRDAVEGLLAIGADGDKQLLDEALQLFGTIPPSEDRAERHRQVAEMAQRDDSPFRSIESRFFEDKNDREVLLLKHIVKNVDEFRED
ncbi:MAG: DMP19 family protein [Pirellulaceae bacterium]